MLAAILTRSSHILLALVVALGSVGAEGAVLEWLYWVETPVSSRTPADRQAAARRALDTMLTRLTGLAEVPRTPAIIAALDVPERYYQRYSFVADAGETRLAVSFAPEALRELIAEARLPIWAADRPVALAWIVVEDAPAEPAPTLPDAAADVRLGMAFPLGPERPEAIAAPAEADSGYAAETDPGALSPALVDGTVVTQLHATRKIILSSASHHPLATALRKRARERGIEILLPLMDLEDRGRIQPLTLVHGYTYTIREASARYRPDYIILGHARREGASGWLTDWRLWLDEAEPEPAPFPVPTPDAASSAIRVVDMAGDALAERFAVTGAEAGFVMLEVRGVNSVAGYAGLLRHLEGLAFLDRVELVEANTEALMLRVATRSSRTRLSDLLTAGDAFELGAGTPTSGAAAAPLRLWWTGATSPTVRQARRPPRTLLRPPGDAFDGLGHIDTLAAGGTEAAPQHGR